MNGERELGGNSAFKAKLTIKRKSLPTRPINIRISASKEEASEGGTFGAANPAKAQEQAFVFPSSPRAKVPKGIRTPSGRKGSYK